MSDDLPQSLIEAVRYFSDLAVCNDFMRRIKWPDGKVACPHCSEQRIAESADGKRLQCRDCRKKFSFKTGTIFEDSPLGLDKWFVAVWCEAHKIRVSTERLGELMGVTQKSAWLMRERIRAAQQLLEAA